MGNVVFACAYRLYLTGIGRARHNSQLAGLRTSGVHPHSFFSKEQNVEQFVYGDIQVIPVPFLEDNLAYIVLDTVSGKYFLVDPADFDAVEEVKEAYGISGAPEAVVTTHKHWDHAGHNQRYADAYPDLPIICGRNEPVYAANVQLDDGQSYTRELFGGKVGIEAFETPCHTAAHNMFIMTINDRRDGVNTMIFTGDCLFEGGVGMFFEGNADQMYTIMQRLFTEKVTENHDKCVLFFGHDYGWKFYLWAADHLYGDRELTQSQDSELHSYKKLVTERKDQLLQKRQAGFYNTGTLLSDEMSLSPFMKAYLQSANSSEGLPETSFLSWVVSEYQANIPEGQKTMHLREQGVAAITNLRANRSAADGPLNTLAAEMMTQQAGQHAQPPRSRL